MIIEEEYYLEHFGVKGMKWGVRKQKSASETAGPPPAKVKKKLTPAQRQRRVNTALLALSGAIFVARIASASRTNQKIRNSNNPAKNPQLRKVLDDQAQVRRSRDAEKWLRQNKFMQDSASTVRSSSGKYKPPKGTMSKDTQDFIRVFTAKQNEQIKFANADLRKLDNDLNIPIHMRSYLEEWI